MHSYLDDLPRVAAERYIPTNGEDQGQRSFDAKLTRLPLDDILRARLKTIGVTELRVDINKSDLFNKFGPGTSLSSGWNIYDVGGHRSMVRGLSLLADVWRFLQVTFSSSEVRASMGFQAIFCSIFDVLFVW